VVLVCLASPDLQHLDLKRPGPSFRPTTSSQTSLSAAMAEEPTSPTTTLDASTPPLSHAHHTHPQTLSVLDTDSYTAHRLVSHDFAWLSSSRTQIYIPTCRPTSSARSLLTAALQASCNSRTPPRYLPRGFRRPRPRGLAPFPPPRLVSPPPEPQLQLQDRIVQYQWECLSNATAYRVGRPECQRSVQGLPHA
jgi:hypothetical protein